MFGLKLESSTVLSEVESCGGLLNPTWVGKTLLEWHIPRVADLYPCAVSHTTDDLVFEWDPIMPLDVDSGIELPQLELTNNFTGDCTTAYSTGTYYSVTLT